MRLHQINIENFRNIAFASVECGQQHHFFLGPNGQGKTNLLEAIGLMTALRSFRTQETRYLIKQGEAQARIFCKVEHETLGQSEVLLSLKPKAKQIELGGEKITRLSDFIGLFPTVVLSSEDIHLLRGAPQARRRFLDMTLAATNEAYFVALRRYHNALRERNSILRNENLDTNSLVAFEKVMAAAAVQLQASRDGLVKKLNVVLKAVYHEISPVEESPKLGLKQDAMFKTEGEFIALMESNRQRDHIMKSTQRGPHRDDLTFQLKDRGAKNYASEGQQRGLVVSLRLAQLRYFQEVKKVAPLVLADDILGELDPVRKAGFWNALGDDFQVLATGTELPAEREGRSWNIHFVSNGTFKTCDES